MTKSDAATRLVAGDLYDPHGFLGQHPAGKATVVRAWRPDASSVECLVDGEIAAKLEQVHDAGIFEAKIDAPLPLYEVSATYPDGNTFVAHDPYSFEPTLGEMDIHLFGEGTHRRLWDVFGAHVREVEGIRGTSFAVWAPNARSVRVVGPFNNWDGRVYPMRAMGSSGIWELFVPGVEEGAYYKYEIFTSDGLLRMKTDPFAFATEIPPGTASVVHSPRYEWSDGDYMKARTATDPYTSPMSVYEMHIGSWRRKADGTPLSYRELASVLPDYCAELGFTHVELMPVAEHPFGGSWGYQVSHYFAPTARYGTPDDLRFLIDSLHGAGIGVIVDWVPAHFPKDDWALARFDGTALYEHVDPRKGEHPDWGTLVFNYGRNEVRNFLISNASYWLEEFHVDGLRVDAVASMLYLDYSRPEGGWVPNQFGGRENLEAIEFLKQLNMTVYSEYPGVLMIAEESTAWPGVSQPVHLGGLGFGFKWNMGWMHDTLSYFGRDPIHRRFHHNNLTFSFMYAWSENFVLPLSHDEVVHGKGSLLAKMAGDKWRRFANLRSLLAYMWAHPGKKLLFMGAEIGQEREWSHDDELDWFMLEDPSHHGVQRMVADLNRVYKASPALWDNDVSPEGFRWIDANDADNNVISFIRLSRDGKHQLVCIANFSPVPRSGFRIGLPGPGEWVEVLNTDAGIYGGTNMGNMGTVIAEDVSWHGLPNSALLSLPPLGVLWLST
ncbi:MAG TPA: 1,4-alpha-glucan branching protein GlgB [Actinomycetota bacterium]|nr:1,4-alpha-glucan branching protein GlgB [Actinomycetota bacterium]